MKQTTTSVVCCAILLVLSVDALADSPPAHMRDAPESGATPIERARHINDIQRLRDLATSNDDAEALTARAEIAAIDGDVDASLRFATQAVQKATTDERRAKALAVKAEALSELGRTAEAEKELRAFLSEHPQAHPVRLALGLILLHRGAKPEGTLVLDAFSSFFNNGMMKTADELTMVSKAMAAIGSYEDANYAMQKAVETNPRDGQALVQWGDLLLSKYNTADAEVVYKEALGLNPTNADAHVGLAKTELELSNDYGKIREHLGKAERVAPEHVEMLLTKAEVAVADTDCDGARKAANQILTNRPRNLEALTFIAVCDYLDDDRAAFEATKKKVLALNPLYARVLTETSRFAVRVHRYAEAVELDREALRLVPDYPPALVGLGIGLSRIGKEDEALQVFQRAYEVDPYNVRAFNMVELYEVEMKNYEFTDFGRYRVRAHRSENETIATLVSPVVDDALTEFDKKYAFQPAADYLAVEVFPNPTTFAVRSVGLPSVSPHGICFGKVVVSRSPSDGNFNWRQVLWHELAHVYHIQMSHSRVPRWFTEGLAEYETNVKDPAWARYHDRELAAALNAGTLRGVLDLSEGFTHARSLDEIVRAYHQSSLVIHFIDQKWGFNVIPKMLRAWGEFKDTPEVLATVLSTDAKTFDAEFAKWLRHRYLNFSRQLTLDLATIGAPDELEEAVRKDPKNGLGWAHLAVARYRSGDPQNADLAINQAVSVAPGNPEVNAIAALYFYDRGRVKDAYARGLEVLDAGRDSYELRLLLGSASMKLEDVVAAHVHYNSAVQLWGDGRDAWDGLARVARSRGDAELSARAQERLFELDQNDPQIARQRAMDSKREADWASTYIAARRWFDITPFDSRAAEALAEAAAQVGKPDDAVDAYRALAVLRPDESEGILLAAIASLNRLGHGKQAKELAETARVQKVSEEKVRRALQ